MDPNEDAAVPQNEPPKDRTTGDGHTIQHQPNKVRPLSRNEATGPHPADAVAEHPPHEARTTVVAQTHYTRNGDHQPRTYPLKFYTFHDKSVSPYEADFDAGPEWVRLDVGALKAAGLLVLTNLEGYGTGRVLSDEEKRAVAGRIVEVGVFIPPKEEKGRTQWSNPKEQGMPLGEDKPLCFGIARPGKGMILEPYLLERLWVRCVGGTARCRLALLPSGS